MEKDLPISAWSEWEIIEKIGEGSFGKVYKAQRIENNLYFYSAIKIITIPFSDSEWEIVQSETKDEKVTQKYFKNIVDECIQEVITMENFRGNSFIVSVEDFKVVEHIEGRGFDIFIRMELLKNFTDYYTGKKFTEIEALKLGIDLCKAMEYCDKLNIIHRDIKPENIFVSRFGDFKLGDFGIARELEKTMRGYSRKGTDLYMAPEIYRGENYDTRADIYSIGIVLYKLMNKNRLPFMNLEKQLITHKDKEIALNKRLSGEQLTAPLEADDLFAKVILKACEYNKENRYIDARSFRKDLEHILQNKEGSAKTVKEEAEEKKQGKKHDPVVTMLGISVVIIAIAICVLTGAYVKLLMENNAEKRTEEMFKLIEKQRDEIINEEQQYFSETIERIADRVTYILRNESNYEEKGEKGKKAVYYDGEEIVKVYIYPKLSSEGACEQYYYQDNQLVFANIWYNEGNEDFYFYENGNLIRWIDKESIRHDQEEDNAEYVRRGDKYWSNAVNHSSN